VAELAKTKGRRPDMKPRLQNRPPPGPAHVASEPSGQVPMEFQGASYAAPAAACAADVLRYLASTAASSVSTIAREVGASRSLVFRVIRELEQRELVTSTEPGRYWLGLGSLEIGGAYAAKSDYTQSTHSALAQAAQATGATVNVGVLRGHEVVYVMRHDSPDAPLIYTHQGMRRPANCTGLGKALLAELTEKELKSRFQGGLPALTPKSITSMTELVRELSAVRERGYAIERGETVTGRCCLATKVEITQAGAGLVALSLSVTEDGFEERMDELLAALFELRSRLEREQRARNALGMTSVQ